MNTGRPKPDHGTNENNAHGHQDTDHPDDHPAPRGRNTRGYVMHVVGRQSPKWWTHVRRWRYPIRPPSRSTNSAPSWSCRSRWLSYVLHLQWTVAPGYDRSDPGGSDRVR